MDTSDVHLQDLASYYQSLIGITRWMVELGRVDIAVMISKLCASAKSGLLVCLRGDQVCIVTATHRIP